MSLIVGAWELNVAGLPGQLNVTQLLQDGRFDATLNFSGWSGPPEITGVYDEASGRVTMFAKGQQPLFFEGYLFATPKEASPGEDVVWTIAGSVTYWTFTSLLRAWGGNKRPMTYGWTGQIKQIS